MKYVVGAALGLVCALIGAKVALSLRFEAQTSRNVPNWPEHPSNRYRSAQIRPIRGGYAYE